MSARYRLAAVSLAVVLVIVPVVFGLVGGEVGTLIGLAFSGLSVVVVGVGLAVLRTIDRRLRAIRRTVARRRDGTPAQAPPVRAARQAAKADLRAEREKLAKRVQDLVALYHRVPITAGIPTLGGWTASADLLVELVDRFVEERPSTVVEAGSGVSTVVLALAAREHGIDARIVSLEHDPAFAESTRRLLARHGVSEHAEVRLAPLAQTSLDDHPTPWYAEPALDDLTDVGLVLVDGPPEGTGPRARFPIVPLLRDRMAARCTILVDDTGRPGDADVVDRWRADFPDFDHEALRFDKGAAILSRR